MSKLTELLKLDAKASEQQILAAVAAQTKKIADTEAAQKQADADEEEILKKTRAGLTREQAVSVIRRQREYDKTGEQAVAKIRTTLAAS